VETLVRTPQLVFMLPQRLVVPLFQRPYVWSEDSQWEPLWSDVTRVADRVLARPHERHQPHFLGAVVLQQVQKPTGQMQERTIIDGQQRLTTLQLMLDALHAELLGAGAIGPAKRLESLVANDEHFCSKPEDRFKVWPTNRDRRPFNAVMGATPPVDYDALGHSGERMVDAHRFFSRAAREWLALEGSDRVQARAAAVESVVRDLLQMVVIDLGVDENAQEIFETLNARGAPLTSADLIKNFIFQRLLERGPNVEQAYETNWKDFETWFWETEVSAGRLRQPRSAIFLNQWLVARTGEEVVAREVFARFKRFADHDSGVSMATLLDQIHVAAGVYRRFIDSASTFTGPIDRVGLFGYRTGVLESEVVKPLVIYLLDPELPAIPEAQLAKALDVVESWMVRRMLVRATTKSYSQVIAELVALLRRSDRQRAGELLEEHLAAQSSGSRYWPDDVELRQELESLPAYRRLARGRLRMVFEAVEDHLRGWRDGRRGLGDERVARGKLAIEHVMPRKWQAHWPLQDGARGETERERLIHTLGNLTLLTGKLNSKVSNGPWQGEDGKRSGLEAHDVLVLNRELLRKARDRWNEDSIRARTLELTEYIIAVWPAPPGHRSGFSPDRQPRLHKKIDMSDLIAAGALEPGMPLYPRRRKLAHHVATLLADGRVEVDGVAYEGPSDAASAIAGRRTNGWWLFLVSQAPRRALRDVRSDYVNAIAVDVDDDDDDDDDDEG
jgi:hypothetical protein